MRRDGRFKAGKGGGGGAEVLGVVRWGEAQEKPVLVDTFITPCICICKLVYRAAGGGGGGGTSFNGL